MDGEALKIMQMMMKIVLLFLFLLEKYYPKEGKFKYFFSKDYGPSFSVFGLEGNLFEKSSLNIHKKEDANAFFTGFTSDYEINGGEKEFKVEELEVFQIISH